MRLSPHFVLKELTKSQTATRMGIDNTPNDTEIESLRVVCENILEPVRANFKIPFSPSSGFRCKELNEAIGGSPTSQHSLGQAADFEIFGVSNLEIALWIKYNLDFDQLILEYYDNDDPSSGWVHASILTNGNRKECFTFDGKIYWGGIEGKGS